MKINSDNLILTSIMSRKTGAPQINGYGKREKPFYKNQNGKIKRFINTVEKIKVNSVILYDLPIDFDEHFPQSNPKHDNPYLYTKFVNSDGLHRYDHCDNRFYLYRDFLERHSAKNIFLTDCNDVYFNDDPFKIFSKDFDLYVGSEYRNTGWLAQKFRQINKSGVKWVKPDETQNNNLVRYNMGIIGGEKPMILKFINFIIDYMEEVDKNIGADSPAGILTLHNHFNLKRVFTGMPLHNNFRMPGAKDKENTRGNSYIVHK